MCKIIIDKGSACYIEDENVMMLYLKAAQNLLNDKLICNGTVSYYDVYETLGIIDQDGTKEMDKDFIEYLKHNGWSIKKEEHDVFSDNFIDLGIEKHIIYHLELNGTSINTEDN